MDKLNETIIKAYNETILKPIFEGKEEAQAIRDAIKQKFKLTSRDVSVKTRSGAMSSAVNVMMKTIKSLPYMKKIKEISSGHERYTRDQATGSILGGGNTFIFTELDWQFRNKLTDKIETEMKKQMTDDYLNDIGTNAVDIFGYKVIKERGGGYYVPNPKNRTVGQSNMNKKSAANRVLSLMIELEDNKNLKKLG